MPRHSPNTMTKAKVLRTLVGEPITDKALKEIYDRLDDLQPDLEAKQSPIRKRESPVGSTMLARNYKGEFLLAVKTPMGYQVDLNANLVPLSKGNKPSKGLRSNNNKPIKNEALLYDESGNLNTYSQLTVNGSLITTGNTTIGGDLTVSGNEIDGGTSLTLRSNESMNFQVDYDDETSDADGVRWYFVHNNAGTGVVQILDSGAINTLGTITAQTISEVGSDTDKILMSDSGEIKYVTGANLRSYIGAGTSSVSALNDLSDVTYSSGDLTISSLDQIIADDFVVDSGASITLDSHSGNFIAKKAGTEFSAANSSYAGMILGYTRIADNQTDNGNETITIGTSMTVLQTVEGTNVSVAFVAPPSGNVEIVFSGYIYASSKHLYFGLSDNATFAEVGETHTYDSGAGYHDETDRRVYTIRFAVTGLTAGTSYTYYIGAKASGSSAYLYHGRFRTGGTHYPPIIVKATALPATIVTGE